jgi:hypothetical protein
VNWIDPGSAYSQEFFPQPWLVDDTSLEDGEIEFSYLNTKANDRYSDSFPPRALRGGMPYLVAIKPAIRARER